MGVIGVALSWTALAISLLVTVVSFVAWAVHVDPAPVPGLTRTPAPAWADLGLELGGWVLLAGPGLGALVGAGWNVATAVLHPRLCAASAVPFLAAWLPVALQLAIVATLAWLWSP